MPAINLNFSKKKYAQVFLWLMPQYLIFGFGTKLVSLFIKEPIRRRGFKKHPSYGNYLASLLPYKFYLPSYFCVLYSTMRDGWTRRASTLKGKEEAEATHQLPPKGNPSLWYF